MRKTVRLTAKTARELARKVLGVSAKLEKEKTPPDVCIYKMRMGELKVTIENDWYKGDGLYKVELDTESSGVLWMFYRPETLEPDDEANQRALRELWKDD